MRVLFVIAASVALTACVTAQGSLSAGTRSADVSELVYAGSRGPVYLDVINAPFGEDSGIAEAMATAGSGILTGADIGFTADPHAAPLPQYRVVAAFDVPVAFRPEALCDAAGQSLSGDRDPERTGLSMAFCVGTEDHAGVNLAGPALTGPTDPVLVEMVRTGLKTMFRTQTPPKTGGR